MAACWKDAGEVIKAWATEGHSVALPGLGNNITCYDRNGDIVKRVTSTDPGTVEETEQGDDGGGDGGDGLYND